MEDDFDIYGDLPSFDGRGNECYIQKNKELTKKCSSLEQQITELKLKIASSEHDLSTLKNNVSSLLKTAKAEIGRKDRMISELRQQLDNAAFRRGNYKKPIHHRKHHSSRKEQEDTVKNNNASTDIKSEQLQSFAKPISSSSSENESESWQQKYKPDKTLFGERLRKRIKMEDEAERLKKMEEAKTTVVNKTVPVVVKEEPQSMSIEIKKEFQPEDIIPALNIKTEHCSKSSISSTIGSSHTYTDYENNSNCRDRRLHKKIGYDDPVHSDKKRRRNENDRYENEVTRYPGDDYRHGDSYQMERDENCPRWRDSEKSMEVRTKNYYPEDQWEREERRDRFKPLYRSRTRTPDRRRNERKTDRYQTETHKNYDEKHDKYRDDVPTRVNGNSHDSKKDLVDLREKIMHKKDSKASSRNSGFNDHRNRDSDNYSERRAWTKSRSPEKLRCSSRSSNTNNKSYKERSISRDRITGVKSRTEKSLKSSTEAIANLKDRKTIKIENELPEISPESSDLTSLPPNVPKSPEEGEISNDFPHENASECKEPAIVAQENMTRNGDAQDKWISVFENDSEVPLIPEHRTSSPKPEETGSRSFREEKIENIEKFIQDYQNNECRCPSLLIEETEPEGPFDENKSGNTTSGIVDTLSMDMECVVTIDKLVEDIVETPVIAKRSPSPPLESLNETKIEQVLTQEISVKDVNIDRPSIENIVSNEIIIEDNVPATAIEICVETTVREEIIDVKTESLETETIVPKEGNKPPRIPCIPIMSKYSRKKHEMVLTDSGSSHCIVMSQSPQRIVTSPTESSKNFQESLASDLQTLHEEPKDLPKVSTEDRSELTSSKLRDVDIELSKNPAEIGMKTESENSCAVITVNSMQDAVEQINIDASQTTTQNIPLTDDKTAKSDVHLEESQKIESISTVSESEDSSKKKVVSISEKIGTAEKSTGSGNSEIRSMELRGTRGALKSIVSSSSSTDSVLCNRKRALPKEKENQSKSIAKQCKITVLARRRRPVVLEDSSSAVTLVSSVTVISNDTESAKNNSVKMDKLGFPKPVTEFSSKGRPKKRAIDK